MKLLIAIVQNEDAKGAMNALLKAGLQVTRLTSQGILGKGSTTLLCGLEEQDLDKAVEALESACDARHVQVEHGHPLFAKADRVRVGGAVVFVVDVTKFIKL